MNLFDFASGFPRPSMVSRRCVVYTVGYSRWSREALLARARSLDAWLVDVRYSPYSRARPEFNREELARAWPDYRHVEPYGNRNFRGGPIELADPVRGAKVLDALLLEQPRDIIMLCACGRHENCHRSFAAAHYKEHLISMDTPCKLEHHYPDGQGLLFE